MPNRILRASLRQSHRWNACSYFDQTLYVRLLMLVDDYGRYEAHPQLLANECFPYGGPDGKPVSCQAVDQSLTAICKADMATLYQVNGNRYIQLTRWKERVRANSKYPEPPNDSQMTVKCLSDDSQMLARSPSPSPSPTTAPTSPSSPSGDANGQRVPTLQEVKNRASMTGMLEADAVAFWNHFESVGWIDKNGHAIVRWESKMDNWKVEARARASQGGNGRPLSLSELRTIFEAKKSHAAELKAAHCAETGLTETWDNQKARLEYIGIRKEMKELNKRIESYEKHS